MIWDCFTFNDELDVLECRLAELQDVPDLTHVLVEGDRTFQGAPKPWVFLENADRFSQWKDRIVRVGAFLPPLEATGDPWQREHAQRNAITVGLAGAAAGDVWLMGDVDEIPTVDACMVEPPDNGFVAFEQTMVAHLLTWRHPETWLGTLAGRVPADVDRLLFAPVRYSRTVTPHRLPSAGWHLSWLGGAEAAARKLHQFSHVEVVGNVEQFGVGRLAGEGWHVDGVRLTPFDGPWPRWVEEGNAPDSWWAS